MKKHILIVNTMMSYAKPFTFLDLPITGDMQHFAEAPEEFALAVFCGGEDVSPKYYGHKNLDSGNNPRRDEIESAAFEVAQKYDIPMAGICRGAQFLCAMSGGTLIQDVSNHGGVNHLLATNDGRTILVNSVHHQMQHPWNLPKENFEVIAWGNKPHSTHYLHETSPAIPAIKATKEMLLEPDCVFYKKDIKGRTVNGLAMQYHPEYNSCPREGVIYAQELIEMYLVPLLKERGAYGQPQGKNSAQAVS
jgi:anthranilate/para-aminobenzoate synthase component II